MGGGGGVQNLVLGFTDEELEEILGSPLDGSEEDQAVEERISEALKIQPVSEFGDVWICGTHKVMCGDSTDRKQVETLSPKADVLLTDPPYGISIVRNGHVGGRKSPLGLGKKQIVDSREYLPVKADESTETARKAVEIALSLTEKQIIFGGNYFTDFLTPSSCWLVWDKKNEGTDFADCELAWTSYDRAVRKYEWLWNGLLRAGDRQDEGISRIHPTQKPVGLLAEILNDYTKEGQTVLDLFGGSGSTLIACEKTGRVCYLMEYERAYVDLIIKRWQDYSGKRAFRESDGRFYDDLKNAQGNKTTTDTD